MAPDVEEDDDGELRIAVLGRPNIGKSTLVNRLIGEDRHVVHDMPGTTMDAIDSILETPEGKVRLVDTAGIRRRRGSGNWNLGYARAIKAIERHVTLLMVDGELGPRSGQLPRCADRGPRARMCSADQPVGCRPEDGRPQQRCIERRAAG